ncbi:MAG: HRDC domain-containing protein [Desulfitobacteriaceae bacterium]|nr:HRDC domain-containing protein [Desulfitobacteriaceae bacterium]
MPDLIEKMPDSKASLLKVSGFGDVKVGKYGEEILEILDDFR